MFDMNEGNIENIEDTQKDKYLTFCLDNETFGIEIRFVSEIISLQPITPIPDVSLYIKGVINLRGKIIPVIDVRLRFNKQAIEYNDRTCIIVINIKDIFVGLIVDTVSEVLTIPPQDIIQPHQYGNLAHSKFIKFIGKVGDNVKLIVDCEKLVNNELEEMQNEVVQ
ncbi:chemotaxis protein CheW [Caldicellulosiruptoraceae bacterium PP1]